MGLETILIATAAAASVTSAASAIAAGQSQSRAMKFNAQVNDRNAQISEQQGEVFQRNEEVSISRFQEDIRDLLDAQSQAIRYNGAVASSGTPLRLRMESANEADEEIALRRYNIAVGKTQAQESATQQRLQGNLNRLYAKQARVNAAFRAGSSLLRGAQQGASFASVGGFG